MLEWSSVFGFGTIFAAENRSYLNILLTSSSAVLTDIACNSKIPIQELGLGGRYEQFFPYNCLFELDGFPAKSLFGPSKVLWFLIIRPKRHPDWSSCLGKN